MGIFEQIRGAVIDGDDRAIDGLVAVALADGLLPEKVLREGLLPAMQEVGRRMETEEFYLPDVLLSVRTANVASSRLKPLIIHDTAGDTLGTVVLGSVEGDIHDIGKNLVGMMLEGVGFRVIDVGINVPAARFVEKVTEEKADILALSALLTNTKGRMPEVIAALGDTGIREQVIVMVGGAPVSPEFATEIGADGYADDAGAAARIAQELVRQRAQGSAAQPSVRPDHQDVAVSSTSSKTEAQG